MISFKLLGAHAGAHLDRLVDLHEQSDGVPIALARFVYELVAGRCEADLSRDQLVDAGIAVGVIRGIVIASGIDLVEMAAAVLQNAPAEVPTTEAPAARGENYAEVSS